MAKVIKLPRSRTSAALERQADELAAMAVEIYRSQWCPLNGADLVRLLRERGCEAQVSGSHVLFRKASPGAA